MGVGGYNELGQLGDGTVIRKSSPVQVPGTSWKNIAANGHSSIVVGFMQDNTVWGWGQGPVGDSTSNNYSSPVQVPDIKWYSVTVCGSHVLAMKA